MNEIPFIVRPDHLSTQRTPRYALFTRHARLGESQEAAGGDTQRHDSNTFAQLSSTYFSITETFLKLHQRHAFCVNGPPGQSYVGPGSQQFIIFVRTHHGDVMVVHDLVVTVSVGGNAGELRRRQDMYQTDVVVTFHRTSRHGPFLYKNSN